MIIGLTGVAHSGKSTVARYLMQQYGFREYNFSEGVKLALYRMNPLIVYEERRGYGYFGQTISQYVKDMVDDIGWDEAKKIPMVRQLLQRMGTEAGRDVHGKDVWVNRTFSEMSKDCEWEWKFQDDKLTKHCLSDIVIPDLRFDNEAERIKHHGGVVIKVERGNKPVNTHSSEQGIDATMIDVTFNNTGTFADMQAGIDNLLEYIGYENIRRGRNRDQRQGGAVQDQVPSVQ